MKTEFVTHGRIRQILEAISFDGETVEDFMNAKRESLGRVRVSGDVPPATVARKVLAKKWGEDLRAAIEGSGLGPTEAARQARINRVSFYSIVSGDTVCSPATAYRLFLLIDRDAACDLAARLSQIWCIEIADFFDPLPTPDRVNPA